MPGIEVIVLHVAMHIASCMLHRCRREGAEWPGGPPPHIFYNRRGKSPSLSRHFLLLLTLNKGSTIAKIKM